ncbi:hypothetical protein N9M83_04465 [Candidatus Poseidonia alphae]|nr:hypothetical protein [Candidatus Poseidonia alphae]MDA8759467.1 hypothetical protein [Candidatus Poseidonia alphae]MDB2335336.1 hypothetical protein [Candidatus Poseidonia alphae]
MGRERLVVLLMVAVSLMTSGCISEQQKFYYSIEDSIDEANSESSSDVLFAITLDEKGGSNMDFSDLEIIITQDGTAHNCSTATSGGGCLVVQIDGKDNSSWELGETLNVNENGVDICSQSCIITFTISGPEGAKIVGPTILNTT